jgi:hypothetical protein
MFNRKTIAAVALLGSSASALAQTIPADLALTNFCTGCPAFTTPLGIYQNSASPLYFVNEQGGALKVADATAGTVTTILNFGTGGTAPPGGFTSGGERGLLGFAFHPQFASNSYIFLSYTDGAGDTMIARYTMSALSPATIDLTTRRVILRVDQDFANHNGGHIAFGPDGFLYIGLGDGGSGNDPCNRGQTITPSEIISTGQCAVDAAFTNSGGNANSRALLGAMLRIDVDGTTPDGANELCASGANGGANYAIPASNPFAGSAGFPGACDEIVHLGLRNPWRFSFDRSTGDLLIGDVGQGAREEISFRSNAQMSVAANFGWGCREGFISGPLATCRAGFLPVDPVLDYNRNAGSSITGGYVYRGPITQMRGVYFFADFNTSRIWTATQTAPGVFGNQPTDTNALRTAPSNVSSFGEDAVGNVYVVGYSNGIIYRLTSASGVNPDIILQDGFE